MTRWTRPAMFGALLVGLLGSSTSLLVSTGEPPARPIAAPFCSFELSLFDRAPGHTYFLGSFTDRLVEATPGSVGPSAFSRRTGPPPIDEPVWGQRMRVTAAGGWGADALHDARLTSEPQEVVLVLWGYDTRCSLTYYNGSLPAGVPGEEALVVARLRDPDQWADGLPTLDMFWGGLMVYPRQSLTEERAVSEWARPPRLSAEEAFQLMGMLPHPCEEVRDPLSFAAKSTIVKTAYLMDGREPLPHVLRGLEIRADGVDRRRSGCLADPRRMPW